MRAKVVTIVPAITSISTDYSDADQIGIVHTLTSILPETSGVVRLTSIAVVDKAKQKPVFDVMFFNDNPTLVSADNEALSISAAEMASKFIGRVRIAAGDWEDTASASDATVRVIDMLLQGIPKSRNLYVLCMAQGAYNAATVTDLVVRMGFEWD